MSYGAYTIYVINCLYEHDLTFNSIVYHNVPYFNAGYVFIYCIFYMRRNLNYYHLVQHET